MRRFGRVCAAAVLAAAMAACGTDGGSGTTTDNGLPDAIVEVTPDNLVAQDNPPAETGPELPAADSAEATAELPPVEVHEEAIEETTPELPVAETTEANDDLPPPDIAGEETTPVDEFALLIAYLEGEGGNYVNTLLPKVIEAKDVMAEGTEAFVILDVRTEDKYGPDASGVWKKEPNGKPDFEDGHIAGAVNVALKDLPAYAREHLDASQKVLVACYTGQTAGIAVAALNLMGYDAFSLKWGMSSWNSVFDLWSGVTSSVYADQFVKTPDEGKNPAGDYPVLHTGASDGPAILDARVDAVLGGTQKFVTVADLMAALEDFYIVNYWPEADYLDPGHVPGAHQYTPKASLHTGADLATLPTDQKIAVYC